MPLRDPDALAEKIDKYTDVIVGFVLLEFLSFWAALINKDFREFLVTLGFSPILLTSIVAVFATCFLLKWCFAAQDELLGSDKDLPKPVKKWIDRTRNGKLIIVCLALEGQVVAFHIMLKDFKMPFH